MNKVKLLLVIVLNLIIAFGYYFDNTDVKVEEISSDLGNIIPICIKIDNPNLYKNDLYLNDIEDVKYYTPFFVQSLRFLSIFTNNDYLQALNLLSFITHFFYGLFWFLLFYKLKNDYWIALIFSVLLRGVLWLPGYELSGISDLWTIMPRTIFLAFLPIPFLIYNDSSQLRIFLASLFLGLIFNLHPITGLGNIILYFSAFILFRYFNQNKISNTTLIQFGIAILFCVLGMLPFLINYITKIDNGILLDKNLFNEAFSYRISTKFTNPIAFIFNWNRPVFYLFGLFFGLFYFFDSSKNKFIFKVLFFVALIIFISANISVYIENIINNVLNKNIRMSFQLIRFQKLIILIFQVGMFFLTVELSKLIAINESIKKYIFLLYMVLLVLSSLPIFSKVPFVGDDLTTSILPKIYKVNPGTTDSYHLSKMINYIEKNTEENAVFYGSYLIRTGAKKSVILDEKGAGMLIEGNPVKFVNWYKERLYFISLNEKEKIIFLKDKNVNYIIDDKPWDELVPIKVIGNIYLYKLTSNERN